MAKASNLWELEWTRVRDVIEKCDERAHDIRKTGFALLSGLLTASALFGGMLKPEVQAKVGLPLALVVLAVLLAIRMAEKQCAIIQGAAAIRARALEILSPVELTETISSRFAQEGWARFTILSYVLFGLAAMLVGITVSPNGWVAVVTIVATLGYFIALVWVGQLGETAPRGADLSVSCVNCRQGDVVAVALVNLDPRSYEVLEPVVNIKRVLNEKGESSNDHSCALQFPKYAAGMKQGHILERQALTWQWKATTPGVYCLEFFAVVDGVPSKANPKCLRKMLRVTAAEEEPARAPPRK